MKCRKRWARMKLVQSFFFHERHLWVHSVYLRSNLKVFEGNVVIRERNVTDLQIYCRRLSKAHLHSILWLISSPLTQKKNRYAGILEPLLRKWRAIFFWLLSFERCVFCYPLILSNIFARFAIEISIISIYLLLYGKTEIYYTHQELFWLIFFKIDQNMMSHRECWSIISAAFYNTTLKV